MKKEESIGLIMVKPHAVEAGLDVTIQDFLNGGNNWLTDRLNLPKEFIEKFLEKTKIYKTFYRDFGDKSAKSRRIIETFYTKARNDRYYPTLLENNLGKVAFFFLLYDGPQDEFNDVINKFKGFPPLYVNSQFVAGHGLRGAILTPSEKANGKTLEGLPDEDYTKAISSILKNGIHTPDSAGETSLALLGIMTARDAIEIKNDNPELYAKIAHLASNPEDKDLQKWITTLAKKG